MALNKPTGSTNNISFGPAIVSMCDWVDVSSVGATNREQFLVDVGYIGEDGVNVELTSEKKNIVQGNPQLIEYSFVTTQSVNISFTSIEWDFDRFVWALGAGSTTTANTGTGTMTTLSFFFGGNPLNTECQIMLQHKMASSGNTLLLKAWKCQSESGFAIPFTATEEHSFEFNFIVLGSDYDWYGSALGAEESLIKFERLSTTP